MIPALVWYLDRATAIVAYPALYLAVVTGVTYNTPAFGSVCQAARRVHFDVAFFAIIVMVGHAVLGTLDAVFIVTGAAPKPAYSMTYFVGGVVLGGVATAVLVVAVLGFLDPRRFSRPLTPKVVHALAYGGFAFATIHAVAIGTDVTGLVHAAMVSGVGFLVYVLLFRLAVEVGIVRGSGTV